ncbi:hypothetical protein ACB098_03G063600 [Castanea mollissima]
MASLSRFSYPKMKSWKADTNCCSRDGVTCGAESGQVVDLDLSNSWLNGPLKSNNSFFSLRHLQKLNLAYNNFTLSTIQSEFGQLIRLTHLNLSFSFLSGQILLEISWMSNLVSLDLSVTYLETLVQNITDLRELQLAFVNISSLVPQSLVILSSLTSLSLANCSLHGQFPTNIFLMPKFSKIDLSYSHFLTSFLPEFHSASSLELLDLCSINFSGILSNSIDNFESLIKLDLSQTKLSWEIPNSIGNLNFDGRLPVSLTNLTQLYTMDIFQNQLIGPIPCEISRLSQLADISLGSNSLTRTILSQLFTMTSLFTLNLSQNQLTGTLKLQNITSSQLNYLDLMINKLYGSIPRTITNFTYIQYLYLTSINPNDMLELNLFFELRSIESLFLSDLSNNKITGKNTSDDCMLNALQVLDLSNNQLIGQIPHCLANFSNSLSILNMRNNSFHRKLAETFTKGSNLRTLDLSLNIINGKIPRSLVNCGMLEVLKLGNNNLNDIFPFWLESLLELKILILLPSEYFNTWNTMLMAPGKINSKPKYMGDHSGYYEDSISVMNKGVEMELELIVLNLSSNSFTGPIPSSFGNLIELQSFDLSQNKFQGEIPQQLTSLTFLAYLNLSQNQLIGPIPQDRQFGTFQNSSFEGNPGLCGFPLSKKCENIETPTFELNQESSYGEGFSWKAVVMGYASGLVIGLVIGHAIISTRSNNWFTRTLGVNLHM